MQKDHNVGIQGQEDTLSRNCDKAANKIQLVHHVYLKELSPNVQITGKLGFHCVCLFWYGIYYIVIL